MRLIIVPKTESKEWNYNHVHLSGHVQHRAGINVFLN